MAVMALMVLECLAKERHLMCSHDSMGVVPPPNTHTVKKTMSSVVVNIIWRA